MRRAKGLVAQYSAIEALPGLKVNGELTLGENIGDLTGLVIAHRAYELSLGGKPAPVHRRPHRRPALLRRLGAGVARQVSATTSCASRCWPTSHAPDMFRATGRCRTSTAFYAAFDVKPGDRLFLPPEQRVKIW